MDPHWHAGCLRTALDPTIKGQSVQEQLYQHAQPSTSIFAHSTCRNYYQFWERKGGGGGWMLAVAMAQLAKGLATDLEVAGSGPVGCCYSIPSCF